MSIKQRTIISEEDFMRLEKLVSDIAASASAEASNLRSLRGELDTAALISPDQIPPDVVAMDSTVHLSD